MNYQFGATFEIRDNGTAIVRRLTQAIIENRTAINGAMGTYQTVNTQMSHMGNTLNTVGHQANTAGGHINHFNNTLSSNVISSVTSKLKGLLATYMGFQAIKGIGTAMINEAASMEGYRNTLNVVMKDTKKAGEMMVWAKDFANKTPFETGEIVDASVKLTSYGINAKQTMTNIGDMAGVMGKSMDQAVEAIADAQTGELERLKEFGITKQQIIDHANKIMKGKEIVNKKGQITDQKAFNNTLFSLMNSRFKGGMELQSKTFKGAMSTMSGVAKDALGQIAGIAGDGTVIKGGLLDSLKDGVITLSGKIQKFVNDGGVKKIQTFVTNAFTALGGAIGFVKDNLNWLLPAVGAAAGMIGAMKVIGTINKLMTFWRTATIVQTVAQWGLNTAMLANPITWIVIGIGLLIAAGIALAMNWDKVKAKAAELHTWLKEKWTAIKDACEPVTTWISEKWEKVTEIFEKVKTKASELADKVKAAWEKVTSFFGFGGDSTVTVNASATKGPANSTGGRNAHKSGLDRVPYDGYQATLHKDEEVLTANEAYDYRNNKKQMPSVTVTIPKLADTIIVREDADIDKVADKLANKLKVTALNLA